MGRAERRNLIREIERQRGSRVVCFLTSDRQNAGAQIAKDVLELMFEQLLVIGRSEQIDVLLYTAGGDTLAAFGLGRLFCEFTDRLGVLVPLRCHSAGTLFALGANEIVMTLGATLSPIDPSISGPLNPAIEIAPGQRQLVPLSVETVAGFKDLVSEDWDIKGEEALTVAFRVLAEKVHPLALGDVYRARKQIERLARKLLMRHRRDDDNIDRVVRTLTRDLGSHDYLISRAEAREILGPQVARDNPDLEDPIWQLCRDFTDEMETRSPYDPQMLLRAARAEEHDSATSLQRVAIIETSDVSLVCEKELRISEVNQQLPLGLPPALLANLPRAIQVEVVRVGWERYTS